MLAETSPLLEGIALVLLPLGAVTAVLCLVGIAVFGSRRRPRPDQIRGDTPHRGAVQGGIIEGDPGQRNRRDAIVPEQGARNTDETADGRADEAVRGHDHPIGWPGTDEAPAHERPVHDRPAHGATHPDVPPQEGGLRDEPLPGAAPRHHRPG